MSPQPPGSGGDPEHDRVARLLREILQARAERTDARATQAGLEQLRGRTRAGGGRGQPGRALTVAAGVAALAVGLSGVAVLLDDRYGPATVVSRPVATSPPTPDPTPVTPAPTSAAPPTAPGPSAPSAGLSSMPVLLPLPGDEVRTLWPTATVGATRTATTAPAASQDPAEAAGAFVRDFLGYPEVDRVLGRTDRVEDGVAVAEVGLGRVVRDGATAVPVTTVLLREVPVPGGSRWAVLSAGAVDLAVDPPTGALTSPAQVTGTVRGVDEQISVELWRPEQPDRLGRATTSGGGLPRARPWAATLSTDAAAGPAVLVAATGSPLGGVQELVALPAELG